VLQFSQRMDIVDDKTSQFIGAAEIIAFTGPEFQGNLNL